MVKRVGLTPVSTMAVTALAAVAAAGAGAVVVSSEDDGGSSRGCDSVVSPGHHAVKRLVRSLEPGDVGCLRGGRYRGSVEIGRHGTPGKPITIQPYPGESATIVGRLWLNRHASHLKIRQLHLDGRNRARLPSPTVNGRHILFVNNDVTNEHTGICFVLGHDRYGVARDVTIQRNRIHDCGRLPATNHDHGVYVAVARDTRVIGNWIYANADLGVHLFPDARRTYVAGNVIDSNGEGVLFGNGDGAAPRDNLIEGNVISNSRLRYNVESYFEDGQPSGTGNVVRLNCVGGGVRDDGAGGGGILTPASGFVGVDNLIAQVAFASTEPGDLRLPPDSPCRAVFRGDPERVPGPRR
jgi:nitrous oxidase accessory protein NosD